MDDLIIVLLTLLFVPILSKIFPTEKRLELCILIVLICTYPGSITLCVLFISIFMKIFPISPCVLLINIFKKTFQLQEIVAIEMKKLVFSLNPGQKEVSISQNTNKCFTVCPLVDVEYGKGCDRLITFRSQMFNWNVSKSELANSGFYFESSTNTAYCFCCQVALTRARAEARNWRANHSDNCLFHHNHQQTPDRQNYHQTLYADTNIRPSVPERALEHEIEIQNVHVQDAFPLLEDGTVNDILHADDIPLANGVALEGVVEDNANGDVGP